MRLTKVRITNYRSIEDSGEVEIGDVTCLVGKNEAGKTAFLQALNKLNPLRGSAEFDETMDYPSRHYAQYKRVRDTEPAPVVSAQLELSKEDMAAVGAEFGEGFLKAKLVTATKSYGSAGRSWGYSIDGAKAIEHVVSGIEAPQAVKAKLLQTTTADDLASAIDQIAEPHSSATAVGEKIKGWETQSFDWAFLNQFLRPRLPKFFYFDDYSLMPGRVSIPDLIARSASGNLDESDETMLRLLDMVGAKLEDFQDQSNFGRLVELPTEVMNG